MKKFLTCFIWLLLFKQMGLPCFAQQVTEKSKILFTSSKNFIQNFPNDSLVTNSDDLIKFKLAYKITLSEEIDFATHIIWIRRCFGDCHASYRFETVTDKDKKTVTIKEYEKYGGCRGMGIKQFVIKIARPPQGYVLKKSYIRLNNEPAENKSIE